MVMEVEIKIEVVGEDIESIVTALNKLGCSYVDRVVEEDIYFNHPCRDFKESDEVVRLRFRRFLNKRSNAIMLTYKGPRRMQGNIKIREEIEVEVKNYEKTYLLLTKLGFNEVARVKKERIIYKCWGTEVTIDNVEALGLFMEIEGSREAITKVLNTLDIRYKPVEKTYLELILEKMKR